MNSDVFETQSPTKLFFRCAIPSMITMVFGALYSIADGIFVGRFVGEDALAAINLIMPIVMIVFGLANLIATGAGVRMSVLLGEKKRKEASVVFTFTLKVIFLLSCVISIVGVLFAESFVLFLSPGATQKTVEYGVIYIQVYAFFAPLSMLFHATDNDLRICGKEVISMWLGIGMQILNIVLDVILIVFLGQGVWAAAFTSCFSMGLGAIISLLMFRKKRLDLFYTKGSVKREVLFRILANGSSEFFSSISMSVMSIVFNFFLLKYGGTTAVAAFSVVMYVDSVVGMLLFGMTDSLQPAISYCYGAGLLSKVKAIFKRVVLFAVVTSVLSMLFMLLLGKHVAWLFIVPGDDDLMRVSITAMKLFSFSYLPGWIDMCFSSFFTSVERPGRSLAVSFMGTLVFPIQFLFVLTPIFQLNGVWLSCVVSCTVSGIFTLVLASTMKLEKRV